MLLLGWLLLGALIGMAAAQKKGFSLAGGVIGGAALGPIGAWLLYLVSGIVPGDQKKRCAPLAIVDQSPSRSTWVPV